MEVKHFPVYKWGNYFVVAVGIALIAFSSCNSGASKARIHHTEIVPARLEDPVASTETIRVGIVPWGGFAGGIYYNGGLPDSRSSRFFQNYGIHLSFKVYNSIDEYREAFKRNEIDLIDVTMDMFAVFSEKLAAEQPEVLFQVDWSVGGDAIIVNKNINSIKELKDKKVAFVPLTAAHTLLLGALRKNGMRYSDLKIKEKNSGEEIVKDFVSGKADAAVIWSPYDAMCLARSGSKVLLSTRENPELIADVFLVRKSFLTSRKAYLKKLVQAWLKANEEINSSTIARNKATQICSDVFHLGINEMQASIGKAKLCGVSDNFSFFGVNTAKGKQIYSLWSETYNKLNYTSSGVPAWDSIIDYNLIEGLNE